MFMAIVVVVVLMKIAMVMFMLIMMIWDVSMFVKVVKKGMGY